MPQDIDPVRVKMAQTVRDIQAAAQAFGVSVDQAVAGLSNFVAKHDEDSKRMPPLGDNDSWTAPDPITSDTITSPKPTPTGNICTNCGSANMIPNGGCLLCANCGTTTGCS